MDAIEELLDLVLPTRCALCARLGSAICVQCADGFEPRPVVVSRGGLLGKAATVFGAREQKILHAFKENGQTALAGFLARPLSVLLLDLAIETDSPLLVPVPSSRENYKKRGFMPTKLLAKRVCRLSGSVCAVSDSLKFQRKVADQAQLDSEARRSNLAGSMLADSQVFGRSVVLFDDVVTTGSTLIEAARAVTLAGGNVIGFIAFAETILKTHSNT